MRGCFIIGGRLPIEREINWGHFGLFLLIHRTQLFRFSNLV